MHSRALGHLFAVAAAVVGAVPAAAQPRPLRVDDVFRLKDVGDPQVSPEGKWVAFTVSVMDAKKDEGDTDVWLAPFGGGAALRLTTSEKSESHPRFSPDGRSIAFLSGREGKKTQVWVLNRAGGEAVRLTDFKSNVSSLTWSPDSTRLAVIVTDVDPDDAGDDEDGDKKKTPKPVVVRRLQMKRDYEGYLTDRRDHVHVFDVEHKTAFQLTSGAYDDSDPAWSPDGRSIAFVSNRTADPDASRDSDVFVVEARPGATPRKLSTGAGGDDAPAWSPDGRSIAYRAGGDPKDMWYAATHVAVIAADGGSAPRPLTAAVDRNVAGLKFAGDGRWIYFLLEDGGNQHLARVPAAGGPVERVVTGERDVQQFSMAPKGEIAVLASEPHLPSEVFAVGAAGALRRLSTVNDAFLRGIQLGRVERFQAKSPDGTTVQAFLTYPPQAPQGKKLPTILRIHGGPVSQYSTAFELEWQMLAAHGYAVVAANPRGSSGYGTAFSRAIWADWGNKDYQDVMAALDQAIAMGVADPDRLGVGGWSYGGILTDYVITKTTRFKAAISGASEANYLANYGHDHYQYEWETELGLPWQNVDRWVKLSPWFQIEKVTTPTLLMGGAVDWNVPVLNSEQLYQALRRLGRTTELVVYPGQHHGISKPSYVKDRFERYVAWYDQHILGKKAPPPPADTAEATSLLGIPLQKIPPPADRKDELEKNLAKATEDFVKDPDSADAAIWLGRRLSYLGRFQDAIAAYTRAIAKHPQDARLLRHRGHRYITTRQLDKAIADLQGAGRLIEGKPDEVEPDGDPDPRNPTPGSSLHFNVWYHLGLAHYLKGDFESALAAYQRCLAAARGNDDRVVAVSDWTYMTLRRLNRTAEAAKLLESIRPDMNVIENGSYFARLMLYKGLKKPEEVLVAGDPLAVATQGYGVGNWYLYNGDAVRARDIFTSVVAGPQWPAFGFIASEAELARMK
jgi:dipeptidyl aminopeptidase/acylaminoacyl peptidase